MKKLLTIFSLMLALSVVGADYKSFTFTITNAPSDGETIVIGGSTRTWKDTVAIASTQIAIHPELGGNATNLFNHFALYPVSGVIVTKTDTNAVKFQGLSLTATQTGTWADIDETTQTLGASWSIAVPFSNQSATNRNRLANMLVADLNEFANTNQLNQNSNITAQLVGLTNTQTIAGKKFMTNELNEFAGTFRGPLYSDEGSLTNFNLYSAQIFSGEFSGSIGSVTNGFLTNVFLSGPTTTNLVNYGGAISSHGSGIRSQQFGEQADASGDRSVAVGYQAKASAFGATAVGYQSIASEIHAVAFGITAEALATNSIAIGTATEAGHLNSIAIGYGATTTTSNQAVIGSSTVNFVYTPGRIEALQGYTNAVFTGTNAFRGDVAFESGEITTLANGNNAGINPGSKIYVRLTGPTNPFAVCGISGGRDGRFLVLQNSSSYPMTIMHESGLESAATNRISTPSEADVVVSGNPGFAMLIYDSSVSRWIMINDPGDTVSGVTSVALDVPDEFSVSGSPVTSSGTLTLSKATQAANRVWAGPSSGGDAQPSFRAIVPADLGTGTASAGTFLRGDGTWSDTLTGNLNVDGTISAGGVTVGGGEASADVVIAYAKGSLAALDLQYLNQPAGNLGIGTAITYLDATEGAINASLPDPGLDSGPWSPVCIVKRVDQSTNTVTLDSNGGATIDGLASMELIPYRSYIFTHNGENWMSASDAVGRGAANTLLAMDSAGEIPLFKSIISTNGITVTHTDTAIELTRWVAPPASASATGSPGQMAYDSDYLYICTATNTWRRIAHSTW